MAHLCCTSHNLIFMPGFSFLFIFAFLSTCNSFGKLCNQCPQNHYSQTILPNIKSLFIAEPISKSEKRGKLSASQLLSNGKRQRTPCSSFSLLLLICSRSQPFKFGSGGFMYIQPTGSVFPMPLLRGRSIRKRGQKRKRIPKGPQQKMKWIL